MSYEHILTDFSSFVHSPYLFCSCTLWEETRDEPKLRNGPEKVSPLTGAVTSSLHRLKDLQNIGKMPLQVKQTPWAFSLDSEQGPQSLSRSTPSLHCSKWLFAFRN